MANTVCSYFFAPSWDFPPNGPIQVGNVLTSMRAPEQPLATISPEGCVYFVDKHDVEFSTRKLKENRFSMFTRFLNAVGVGINVISAYVNYSQESIYKFDRLSTVQFVPNDNYINRCIHSEWIMRYLEKTHYNSPVYIITGIKTVAGSAAKTGQVRELGGTVNLDTQASNAMPIGGGPSMGFQRQDSEMMSWNRSGEFVFAFRVVKVKVNKKTMEASFHNYEDGAMMGTDEQPYQHDISTLSFTAEEMEPSDFGLTAMTSTWLAEGGESILCIVRD